MKLYKTIGIVFKTLKYSESSIIADIYTQDKGLKSYIISGVRPGKTGGKASLLRPLNIVDLVAYDADGDKLSRIKEISFHAHYKKINFDIVTSSMALFMLEVCRNALMEKETNEPLYHFIESWLHFLDQTDTYSPCYHLLFMVELSGFLGFGPMLNHSIETPIFDLMEGSFCNVVADHRYFIEKERAYLIFQLCHFTKENLPEWKVSKPYRDLLVEDMILYYRLHISNFKELKSLEVLRRVL